MAQLKNILLNEEVIKSNDPNILELVSGLNTNLHNHNNLYYTKPEVNALIAGSGGGGTSNEIYNETPAGAINGLNTIFTLSNSCVSGSTRLFLNGIRQKLGNDYTQSSPTTIAFTFPPFTGDEIVLDYTLFI